MPCADRQLVSNLSIGAVGVSTRNELRTPPKYRALSLLVFFLVLVGCVLRCPAATTVPAEESAWLAQYETDLQTLCTAPPGQSVSRALGTAGYDRTADYLQSQIAGIAKDHANVAVAPVHEYPM